MISFTKKCVLVGTCLSMFMIPTVVFGQDLGIDLVSGAAGSAGYDAATNDTTLATTIGMVIRVALSFVGVIFTVLAVYAGFMWMTARGNENQVEDAKATLRNALIGLFIAIGSYAITGFVVRAFETGSAPPTTTSATP